MVGEARRNREGWRNRRLGLQPVPAADRVLVGQVGPNTAAEVAASANSAPSGRLTAASPEPRRRSRLPVKQTSPIQHKEERRLGKDWVNKVNYRGWAEYLKQ